MTTKKKYKRIRQHGLRCPNCFQHMYSNFRHDYKSCWCGAITIDGGFDYMRCGWDGTYATRETTKSISRYVYIKILTPEEKAKRNLEFYKQFIGWRM